MCQPQRESDLVDRVWAINDYVMHRLPGGAGLCRPRQPINLHKLGIGPLVLVLMFATGNFTLVAWTYLVLHGLYGVMWVAKDIAFGDPSWAQRCSLGSAITIFVWPLAGYALAPLLLLTDLREVIGGGWGDPAATPPTVIALAVALFVLGSFFHFASDCQKHFVLKHQRPRALIVDGLFSLTRNPNYLGEIMIYASFNVLAQHWLPWVVCSIVWVQVFLVNMIRKERSMSRYPEHAAWVARTGFVLPSLRGILGALPRIFFDDRATGTNP